MKKYYKIISILVKMIFFIFGLILLIFLLAKYSIFSKELPEHSDGMIFLMGGKEDRVKLATSLYKQGYAPKIWLVNLDAKGGNSVNENGIPLSELAKREKYELIKAGFDSSVIYIIDGPSNSTFDEAKRMGSFLKSDTSIKKVLIVTSATHTGRANYIFEDYFKTELLDVKVITPSNTFSSINHENYVFSFESIIIGFTECVKWFYYVLFRKSWLN